MLKMLIVVVSALMTGLVLADTKPSLPLAPVITYGLVRDEYGTPLTKASQTMLTLLKNAERNGRTFATCEVGDSGIPGMNYRLSLEIDSSGPRRSYAVLEGTEMFVNVTRGGGVETLSPVATFVTPAQGTKQRLDYALGGDADGDGMPDEWEEWVLTLAGRDSSPAGIAAFKPEDDADSDGMTNLQEYLAGSDPFLATDMFKIESFELVQGGSRAKLTFNTVVDRTYRVLMSESLDHVNWTPVATAKEAGGELAYEPIAGNGRRVTVYVDARLETMFFRVAAD